MLKAEDLSRLSKEYKGKTVEVIYSRASVEKFAKVALRADNADGKRLPRRRLGATRIDQSQLVGADRRCRHDAPANAVTLQGLGDVIGKAIGGW